MGPIADHDDDALDAALEMTFPASDPVAVYLHAESIAPALAAASHTAS